MLLCSLAFFSLVLCNVSWAVYDPDEVTDLPGMSFKPNYKQWSGYLKASPGKYLHYWFVTSQGDPGKDPVVLWLNGGPGCSSLDGFLSENGPFHVTHKGATLYPNEFSWNKIANVLYLESPAGVGYSYSDDKDYETDDDKVANDNYLALQSFFLKFPSFAKNEFYVFGESYGGIYTPTLSLRVATGAAKINLKGFGVGNGLSSYDLNDQSLIYFAYYHGLLGEQLWADLNKYCCKDGVCKFYNSTVGDCAQMVSVAFHVVFESGLNTYALYRDCAGGVGAARSYHHMMRNLFRSYRKYWGTDYLVSREGDGRVPQMGLKNVPPCIDSTAQLIWLNRGDVRKALHIPDTLPPWDFCSPSVEGHYNRNYTTMKPQYLKLLGLGLRVLVYNGDTDMACNFLGDQWFVEQLNLPETTSYQPWLLDKQVAGFYQQFGNITFLTVKGAGHMVPQWAPGPALHMFQSFLANKAY